MHNGKKIIDHINIYIVYLIRDKSTKGYRMDNLANYEISINALIDQLDLAISENDNDKVIKIGEAIEALLEELKGDTIKIRIFH